MLACLCLALLAALPAPQTPAPATSADGQVAGDASASPWVEGRLANGLRWIVVDAPLAEEQVHFTLLPWGLLSDGPGEAQLSHLGEHLVVRSLAPAATDLRVEGILLGGETMALNLRLDTYAPIDRWETALGWHGSWLERRALASPALPALLGRERGRVDEELKQTCAQGYSHKWALAAWNQVVRHGRGHAAVQGDLATVREQTLLEVAARRVGAGDGVLFVSVGPVPRAEVVAAIEIRLGALPQWAAVLPAPAAERGSIVAPGERRATWDLPLGHYLEWYPVPGGDAASLVGADALAFLLNTRLQQRGHLGASGIQAHATADLITPEGRWLLLSASLPRLEDEAVVRAEIAEVLAGLRELPEAPLVVGQMTSQLAEWPDFAALRAQFGAQPGVDWIEAQQVLFLVYAQLNLGLGLFDLAEAYSRLTRAGLEAFAAQVLVADRASVLVLAPAG